MESVSNHTISPHTFFFSYAEKARELSGDSTPWKDTIVGCIECQQSKFIACRNWAILTAHEDDFFIRTDNPVYLTGFIELDESTLFYPLTPKKCFVACSMPSHIPILKGTEPPFPKLTGIQLEKGDAFSINFELSKSASKSIILQIDDESAAYETLLTQTLGVFPQLPFFLHSVKDYGGELDAMESLLHIMSATDQISYLEREYPFKPFYGVEFEMGLNPFSIFGVTDAVLAER